LSEQSRDTVLEFPCRFPIKMMGRDESDFRAIVTAIVARHAGPIVDEDVYEAASSNGNFVSVTIKIDATDQQQLDSIYRDLTAHEQVLVAL